MSDITSRRGRVQEWRAGKFEELHKCYKCKYSAFGNDTLQHGFDSNDPNKAMFEMNFFYYEPINGKIAEKVKEDRKLMLEEKN